MKKNLLLWLFFVMMVQMPFAFAQDSDDIEVFGVELEKLLNLVSALLALTLLAFTLLAYQRSRNERLIFVSLAFFLFAVKGALVSMEILLGDWSWVDPVASVLDFAILLSFFLGIIKK